MKKVIRLTERDLNRIVRRVIREEKIEKYSLMDLPRNPLDLMARTLRENDIEYSWPLNKDFLNIEDSNYRIYLNDNGTYRVQDKDAKNIDDKIYYTSPRFGHKEDQTPETNSSDGANYVVDWLNRWG